MRTLAITKCAGIALLCVLAAVPLIASAHALEANKDIGIVLHIDPSDTPVPGSPSRIYLEFKNKNGAFSISECSCALSIAKHGSAAVFRVALAQSQADPALADASFSFPSAGVYTLRVEGVPVSGPGFTPFDATFDVRVSEGSAPVRSFVQGHALHALIIGGGFVFFFGAVLYDKRKRQFADQM